MIQIHPGIELSFDCPVCHVSVKASEVYIPGMRSMVAGRCERCGKSYFADLPVGHGLTYPMVIEAETGIAHDKNNVDWFAEWLRSSYKNRESRAPEIKTQNFKPVRKALLVNCIDKLYGHSLLKLLNVQFHLDHHPDFDVVVIIQPPFRWLVPEGVAEVWIVDIPLSRGIEWNDGLAVKISEKIKGWDQCWISIALSHPHPNDFDIKRYSGIEPFPIRQWAERLKDKPVLTYIWREDRLWESSKPSKLKIRAGSTLSSQQKLVEELYLLLKSEFSNLDFAVAGIGEERKFQDGILNLVSKRFDDENERKLCERYSNSHIVIGVHGSNMLLPSAHSGAVIEILPSDRWRNFVQDLLPAESDVRYALCRYRFLLMPVKPADVAVCASSMLKTLPYSLLNFREDLMRTFSANNPWRIMRERQSIS